MNSSVCTESLQKGVWVYLDDKDLFCPISLTRYDERNYPISLMCGHIFSITTFQSLTTKKCPICSQKIDVGFNPQKLILCASIIKQIETKKAFYCNDHPQIEAIGFCREDKKYLCPDCSLSKSHRNHKKQVLEKFSLPKKTNESQRSLPGNAKKFF